MQWEWRPYTLSFFFISPCVSQDVSTSESVTLCDSAYDTRLFQHLVTIYLRSTNSSALVLIRYHCGRTVPTINTENKGGWIGANAGSEFFIPVHTFFAVEVCDRWCRFLLRKSADKVTRDVTENLMPKRSLSSALVTGRDPTYISEREEEIWSSWTSKIVRDIQD